MPSVTTLTPALLMVAAVLGLAVGSFLNVVIHRVPAGLSLSHPGSRCPSCETPIKARHNVPVLGWLLLRGRCHSCRAPIAARYPLVEAGTALAFVGVTGALLAGARGERLAVLAPVPAWLWLTATSIAATLIELDGHRVPARFGVLTAAVVAVLVLATLIPAGAAGSLLRAGIGAIVVGGVPPLLRRDRVDLIGFGSAAGLTLGAVSWPALVVGGAGSILGVALTRVRPGPALAVTTGAAAAGLAVAAAAGF